VSLAVIRSTRDTNVNDQSSPFILATRRINNAGIALTGFDASVVEKTFALNYHHVTDFNERVLPVLKTGGRIVILASMAGALNGYSSEIVERFRSVSSKKGADEMALEYQREAKDSIGTLRQRGWKEAAYSVSKCCVIAYTRGKANDLQKAGVTDKLINCCCPGYVNTDM
jgi:carbonyl reductase 1